MNLAVKSGMLRKFFDRGEWRYVDNRVPPTQKELLQDKTLKNWTKPTKQQEKNILKKFNKYCKEARIDKE